MYISAPATESTKVIGGVGPSGEIREAISGALSKQQSSYFDLKDAHEVHSWLRATSAAFGRTVIGPGMTLAPDTMYGDNADTSDRDLLYEFYTGAAGRDFNNISDWYPFTAKMYRTAGQFRLFGQATWELRRDGFGNAVSFDVVSGFVWPNCKPDGTFKDPPFKQFISANKVVPLELDPSDIVMFMHPDFGSRLFSTDFESLSEFVLPTDIYLNTAMRSLLENHRTPFGVFSLDEHATQEEVDNFSVKLDSLYRGAANFGKSAVVVRGETEFKPVSPPITELPFEEGHNSMKDEIEGVSGVSGTKLGRTGSMSRSNLREVRRDYWETTHQPIVRMLADQMYLLIHQRIFGIRSWRPVFKAPDFLTQVEKATVGMRGRQWGALNTNEFRNYVYDMQPIKDEWADTDYLTPKNMTTVGSSGPAEGEEPIEEPSTDSDPPVRGDTNNTEEIRTAILDEVKAYSRFVLNRWGQDQTREFEFHVVPADYVEVIDEALREWGTTRDNAKSVFDAVIGGLRNG